MEAGKTPTVDQLQQLQAAIASLDQQELTAASQRIEAWSKKNCTVRRGRLRRSLLKQPLRGCVAATDRPRVPRSDVRTHEYLPYVKVLGIDPGTAACGYGIVHGSDGRLRAGVSGAGGHPRASGSTRGC